ncbi:MAG: hypothetical protein H6766_03295 [Candidatus Peribacteria bacterium]|nr:MAG: hypothetical protein H6766_03295 [Candidatus Peribacteria bacterium]
MDDNGGSASLLQLHKAVFHILYWLLIVGWLWQGLKFFFPDIFIQYLGYGPFGDFSPDMAPPVYYLTGPDGHPRLSGLFA